MSCLCFWSCGVNTNDSDTDSERQEEQQRKRKTGKWRRGRWWAKDKRNNLKEEGNKEMKKVMADEAEAEAIIEFTTINIDDTGDKPLEVELLQVITAEADGEAIRELINMDLDEIQTLDKNQPMTMAEEAEAGPDEPAHIDLDDRGLCGDRPLKNWMKYIRMVIEDEEDETAILMTPILEDEDTAETPLDVLKNDLPEEEPKQNRQRRRGTIGKGRNTAKIS